MGGARRSSSSARSLAGLSQTLDQLIAARLVQAVGGGVLVPVATAAAAHLFDGAGAAARARRHRRADVPRDGRRAVRRAPRSSASVHAEDGLGAGRPLGRRVLAPAWRWVFYVNVPIGLIALLARLGRLGGLGHAAAGRAARPARRRSGSASRSLPGSSALTLIGATDRSRAARSTRSRSRSCLLVAAAVTTVVCGRPRRSASPTRSSTRGCSPTGRSRAAVARVAADRLRVRDRDHRRRGLRRSRALRRARPAAAGARRARRRDGGRARSSRASRSASSSLRLVTLVGLALAIGGLCRDGHAGRPTTPIDDGRADAGASSGSGSG